MRRVLLGAVTAWIVARPMVLGEDPGMLSLLTDASGLILTLLWFVTALGWAGWRAWTGKGQWRIDAIEGTLFLIVGLMFVSALYSAAYKHPAYLVAWEWLALFSAFVLVRRLTVAAGDQHRLLAALVASAVSLSAYGVYQYLDELPRTRDMLQTEIDNEKVSEAAKRQYRHLRDRIDLGIYSTFAHPNSYAGYLGLLLPGAVCFAAMCWRQRDSSWRTFVACLAALLIAVALMLTRSKGAILATLLVAGAVAVQQCLFSARTWVFGGLVATAALALFLPAQQDAASGVDKAAGAFARRIDYWSATWRMLNDEKHPRFFWLGAGPGNFSRYYARYMSETADEEISDPHNLVLDVWTSCGMFGAAALLIVLALFVRQVWPALRAPSGDEEDAADTSGTHWEFYLGGMVGLTLGYVLWAVNRPAAYRDMNVLIDEGMVAGVRSLLWFASFALFESIAWPSKMRLLAPLAGIAVLLLNLTVSGGISFPSVALALWVMVALALNASTQAREQRASWLVLVAPVPLTAAACLAFFLLCFYPVTSCTNQQRKAHAYFEAYERSQALKKARDSNVVQAQSMLANTQEYLRSKIIKPLEQAVADDPGDAAAVVQLADWNGQLWDVRFEMQSNDDEALHRLVLGQAQHATRLDPEGLPGYLALYRLNTIFAKRAEASRKPQYYDYAARHMHQVVERVPTHPQLRFQLAEALMNAGKDKEASAEARQALTLDDRMSVPTRKLTDEERDKCKKWSGQ